MKAKTYTPIEIENYLKNDDISILLKLPDDYFDAGKARQYIQRFNHHTLAIYAFCEPAVQANPMVIKAAIPGLAKARRLDLLPAHIREDRATMITAITASNEAYFSLPEKFKDDLDFHMEIADKVTNFLEIPIISRKILGNLDFLEKCLEGTHPAYLPSQILNSPIPDEVKNPLLQAVRIYRYDRNVSLETIKSNVMQTIQRMKASEVIPVDERPNYEEASPEDVKTGGVFEDINSHINKDEMKGLF